MIILRQKQYSFLKKNLYNRLLERTNKQLRNIQELSRNKFVVVTNKGRQIFEKAKRARFRLLNMLK